MEKLTGKEREVLGMIRDGRPNKEIAARLDVTPRAVEFLASIENLRLDKPFTPDDLRAFVQTFLHGWATP